MKLADLPTPCLVLDRAILERNIRVMAAALVTVARMTLAPPSFVSSSAGSWARLSM